MKRKQSNLEEEESRLSKLLFTNKQNLVEQLKTEDNQEHNLEDKKPAWIDEDDHLTSTDIIKNPRTKGIYAEKLKQKYETMVGTPNWAKLNKIKLEDEEDDELLRTVGHLKKAKKVGLPKDFLELKKLPRINENTNPEGKIISCIEFHPKISAALVGGRAGVVSLYSIGGEVNNKLHSFQLKRWKIMSAYFTPDGSEAFVSSFMNHSYCVYNLVKAEPMIVQLPQTVKKPTIFKLSPNGKYIAACTGFDEVHLICAASKELLRTVKHNMNVKSLVFSPECDQLYCYGVQGEIMVWDLSTFRALKKFYDHGCVTASVITVSPCGKLLATGSGEGIVNIYQTSQLNNPEPLPLKVISNLTTKITDLKFNATTEILAASSSFYPNAVKLIQIPSYHVFANFPDQSVNLHQVDTVNFSPHTGYMAVGNNRGTALLYRLKYYKNY